MARKRLLANEAIDGPDPVVALFTLRRFRLRMVGLMRVRRRVGVDQRLPVRVKLVALRLDRMVRVRVRRDRQSEEECQDRKRRTKTAQHDSPILSAAYGPCQASTASRSYNAATNTMPPFIVKGFMRIRVPLGVLVVLGGAVAAQQAINPRQQPGAMVHIFAPEQHDLYDGHFVISANAI